MEQIKLRMGMGNIIIRMEAIMKGNGRKIKCMDKGYCTTQMDRHVMTDNGK
jgi:hypothetical protein